MKETYPNITVFGNPGYVDPRFKRQKAGVVADVVSIEGTTPSFLKAGPNDPEKGSFVYYPPGKHITPIVIESRFLNSLRRFRVLGCQGFTVLAFQGFRVL